MRNVDKDILASEVGLTEAQTASPFVFALSFIHTHPFQLYDQHTYFQNHPIYKRKVS